MQKRNGQFLISLDFELYWGVRDKRSINDYGANIRGVRQVIPALLKMFEAFDINATFATVGFLFCRNKEELLASAPTVLPTYQNPVYSPYHNNYLATIGASEAEDIYHYGRSLIGLIQQHPQHEIGTHTFSHFYCLEGASLEAFEADIAAAKKIAASNGVEIKSIVFPRNQYSPQHIAICKKLGILSYRGNETAGIYQPKKNTDLSLKLRATRLLDSYINLTGTHTHDVFLQEEKDIVNLPASAFLRPYSKKLAPLLPLQLRRIKQGMKHAAKRGEAYHLWWHPHNFGVNLKENLATLKNILTHYAALKQEYGFTSYSMTEMAHQIIAKNEG